MSQSAVATADPHDDPTTTTRIPNKKLLMWAFLASDCMFFGVLIATHLIYRLHPPEGSPDPRAIFDIELTSFSTFILLMSSLMMALAVNSIQANYIRSCRKYLIITIIFGLIFLGCQVYEFWHFVHDLDVTLSNSVFGSTFYTLTGTHGIHVAIGVFWLACYVAYSYHPNFDKKSAIDVETAGLYWHFVDIVWIVIFTVVYLLEYVIEPGPIS